MSKNTEKRKYQKYEFAAELDNGAAPSQTAYGVLVSGTVPSVLIRHVIKNLDQVAIWLEEDGASLAKAEGRDHDR